MLTDNLLELLKDASKATGKKGAAKTPCLTDEALAMLAEGIEATEAAVEHLLVCDDCLEVALEGRRARPHAPITETATESGGGIWDGLAIAVKRLGDGLAPLFLSNGLTLAPEAAHGTARGCATEKGRPVVTVEKVSEPYNFEVEVEAEPDKDAAYSLRISATDSRTKAAAANLRLSLYDCKEQRESDSYVAENGSVAFDGVRAGRYHVNVSEKGARVCRFYIAIV